jgi:cell division protein FtsI/penicillin-binding protein 2
MGLGQRSLALLTLCALSFSAGEAPAATRRRRRAKVPTHPVRRAVYRPPAAPSLVVPVSASAQDLAVGEACRRGLGNVGGSVIAMDPYSGRVITVVNPSLAVETAYQPCSVFKVVVAIAGLTEGVINPDTVYNCEGGCWLWPGHGPINLRRALAVSCNRYFEWAGEQLGYARVQRYAQLLGLGAPSGINLQDEATGRLPLFVGPREVGHLSSHAKGVATSALQLGVLLSATLNGGVIYQPQLSGPAGFSPRERWRLPQGTVLGGLTEGFLGAVNEGSAATAFDPDVSVAGKTGTCAGLGWFASYAPAERPEIVIVVFVRPGTGHLASTVAGRIYQNLYKPGLPATAAGGS